MRRIRERRDELGMTQKDLGEKLSVNKTYISFLERGLRTPSVQLAKRMEAILGIPWTHHFK